MIRGRKPKPMLLKKLQGTAQPCRAVNEPKAPDGELKPSPTIDTTPYAREFFEHYIAFAPLGMIKPVDVPLLERLCIHLSYARVASEKIEQTGLVVMVGQRRDKKGNVIDSGAPQPNPFLLIASRQTEIARKLAAELALPITGRARIDVPDAPLATTRTRSGLTRLDAFIASNPQWRKDGDPN